MKATELRLGNLVYYKIKDSMDERLEWDEIAHIDWDDLRILTNFENNSDYKPIPLTEEWLLKFGFDKAVNGWWSSDEIFSYRDGYFGFGVDRHTKIQYVHELQNLYFALTGEELTI